MVSIEEKRIGQLLKRLERKCDQTILVARELGEIAKRVNSSKRKSRRWKLTWVDALKQWRKRRVVEGKTKTFYLGTGTGKNDRESFAKALAKWKGIVKELDHPNGRKACEVPVSKPPATNGPKLGSCIDEYIAQQRCRYEHGLKFPTAPQRERISGVRFMSYRYNAKLIKADWAEEPIPKDEAAMAALMRRFRESQKLLMNAGTIQPGTVNERIKTLRHVIKWMYEQYLIPSLPRQMQALCCDYQVQSSAKALDLETIRTLWNAASSRFKTFMALGLNCGMYVVDISHLEHSHIQGDYILCDRHKTKVPTRFKLWSATKRLLSENCNGPDRLAFTARNGGPLYVVDPDDCNGSGRRWCQIESDLAALKKKLGIEEVSFSMFRDTSSTMIEGIDRTLTDVFDGHKDSRMARFYVDGEMLDYGRVFGRLDTALSEMERTYDLKLPL